MLNQKSQDGAEPEADEDAEAEAERDVEQRAMVQLARLGEVYLNTHATVEVRIEGSAATLRSASYSTSRCSMRAGDSRHRRTRACSPSVFP